MIWYVIVAPSKHHSILEYHTRVVLMDFVLRVGLDTHLLACIFSPFFAFRTVIFGHELSIDATCLLVCLEHWNISLLRRLVNGLRMADGPFLLYFSIPIHRYVYIL